MLSNIKPYQSDSESVLSFSKLSFVLYIELFVYKRITFDFYIHTKCFTDLMVWRAL